LYESNTQCTLIAFLTTIAVGCSSAPKKEPGVLRRVSLSDNSRINANDGMVTFKMLCLNPRAQKNKKGPSEIIFLVGFKIGFLGTWRAPIAFGK
jgi:hypothetical protein